MPAKGNHEAAATSLPMPMAMTMPRAASTPLLGSSPGSRKDVDVLVQEIKENLKLGGCSFSPAGPTAMASSPKAKASMKLGVGRSRLGGASSRASPYAVPPSSRVGGVGALGNCDTSQCATAVERQSQLRKWNHQRRRYPSTCKSSNDAAANKLDDPFEMLQELLAEGSLVKEAVRRLQLGLSPKLTAAAAATTNANRSFYDSDDECRTPPAYPELCEVGGGMI